MNEGHADESQKRELVGPSAFCSRVLHQSCLTVRGGVLKFTDVVDIDSTLHGVETDTFAFSPSVLIMCNICSYRQSLTRTPHEWLKKTIHDKESYFTTSSEAIDSLRVVVGVVFRVLR